MAAIVGLFIVKGEEVHPEGKTPIVKVKFGHTIFTWYDNFQHQIETRVPLQEVEEVTAVN